MVCDTLGIRFGIHMSDVWGVCPTASIICFSCIKSMTLNCLTPNLPHNYFICIIVHSFLVYLSWHLQWLTGVKRCLSTSIISGLPNFALMSSRRLLRTSCSGCLPLTSRTSLRTNSSCDFTSLTRRTRVARPTRVCVAKFDNMSIVLYVWSPTLISYCIFSQQGRMSWCRPIRDLTWKRKWRWGI